MVGRHSLTTYICHSSVCLRNNVDTLAGLAQARNCLPQPVCLAHARRALDEQAPAFERALEGLFF